MLDAAADPAPPPAAQARVWQRLEGPRPAERPIFGWLLAAGLAAAAVLMWWLPSTPPPASEAPVLVQHEPATPASVEAPVAQASFRSEPDAPASVTLEGIGAFELAPNTEIVRLDAEVPTVEILRGRLTVTVPVAGLELLAGRWTVEPEAGAVVTVARSPESIEVRAGAAWLVEDGQRRRLGAGDQWPVVAAARPDKPRRASVSADPAPSAREPAGPDKPRRASVSADPAPSASEPASPGGPRLREVKVAPSMATLYRQARAEPNPNLAVAAFDRVSAEPGPWAEMAGHQAVRLRMEQGQWQEALTRLADLERRFVGGTHTPELWLARIECHVRLGQPARAHGDLDAYLAAQPDSARAADLFFLRAEIHREAGRCRAARADFARVESGDRREDAAYLAAWCLLEEGQPAAAREGLNRYLQSWPRGRYAADARAALGEIR